MDSFLKKAQQKAAKIGQHASTIAKDAITQARLDSGNMSGGRELIFERGPFGFTLDVVTVDSVSPEGQAAKLGLLVGDRLLAVDGYVVPALRKDATEEDHTKLQDTVRQWLADMVRPGTLTFVSPSPPELAGQHGGDGTPAPQGGDDGTVEAALPEVVPAGTQLAASAPVFSSLPIEEAWAPELKVDLDALPEQARLEVQRMQDVIIRLKCELDVLQAECRELRQAQGELPGGGDRGVADAEDDADVGAEAAAAVAQSVAEATIRSLQEQLAATRSELDAARKHALGVSSELAAEAARTESLRRALAETETVAMDSSAEREQVLEAEVARLRAELHSMEADAAEARRQAQDGLEHAESRISELEGELAVRARQCTELSGQRDAAEKDTQEVSEARSAAQDMVVRLRAELEQATSAQRKQAAEQEELAGRLRDALEELEQFRSAAESQPGAFEEEEEAEAKDVEAPQSAETGGGAERTGSLEEHITLLEERCARLQKKLDTRPVVFRPAHASGAAASSTPLRVPFLCESQIKSACPVGSSLAEVVLKAMDRRLEKIAGKLHASVMLRWVFSAHLFVVYALASSMLGVSEEDEGLIQR